MHRIMITTYLWIVGVLISIGCKPEPQKPSAESVPLSIVNIDTMPVPDLDYIMGKFDPKDTAGFVEIPIAYADRAGLMLRSEALEAFIRMRSQAREDGIVDMQIKSATRNFDYQKGIWERKYSGQTILSDGTNVATDMGSVVDKCLKILEYSSMPGTSRHHWGTDIDINAFNNLYFESGEGLKLYNWLVDHASDYGFCQPYTPHGPDRPHGYNEEKWHWSYMPLSRKLTRQAEVGLKDEMISGFSGASAAKEIGVVNKYVLGINQECR